MRNEKYLLVKRTRVKCVFFALIKSSLRVSSTTFHNQFMNVFSSNYYFISILSIHQLYVSLFSSISSPNYLQNHDIFNPGGLHNLTRVWSWKKLQIQLLFNGNSVKEEDDGKRGKSFFSPCVCVCVDCQSVGIVDIWLHLVVKARMCSEFLIRDTWCNKFFIF